ncbi:MAG: phytanoyl-CoA dioxygenase family protein [Candidatus Pseudobacter hemicellulosilyticus]|uniref:Phytanoyl-CoA dioxygenase family protein n=1 Tax=Candidatus Pseudobacter hemicellulosilyticus TaxID=3121375 RepID=A0AAJ5WTS3_9BACT|nr:MAG: phytanoyl-CoA dioxygenase family protein [Pseudobacter sp.]
MGAPFQLTPGQIAAYHEQGYLVVEQLLSPEELQQYQQVYDDFLSGAIAVGGNRSDLGQGLGDNKKVENITQIMWPSDFVEGMADQPYHLRALQITQQLEGKDMAMDFDMLINKAPFTNTPTPWHQDAAYWINMPDKRALSCWLALDDATLDNGCMWYVPGSHLKLLRAHQSASKGGALVCDASEEEGLGIEIKAGTAILHHGQTLHYSRGNSTASQRRAFIINYRPEAMIALERAQGFDHGRSGNAGDRKVRQ